MSSSPTPFGDAARGYLKLGFWPIPVSGKHPPEPGTTGYDGVVTKKLVKHLESRRATKNVGLRHVDTMALDIDGADHGGKRGDRTLKKAIKKLGALPPTWSSTSYGAGSETRQRFYRVSEGTKLVSDLSKVGFGPDVEVIHHDHRYSVVWPSMHPDTGATYQWFDPDGKKSKTPPHVDELPDLPKKWLKKLTAKVYVEKAIELFDPKTLTTEDNDRLGRWLTSAIDGISSDLDELGKLATPDGLGYKGPPWDDTVFAKAVRLAELAKAPWSPLTLEDAEKVLFGHAPRDGGFTDREVAAKWASAVHTAGASLPLPITAETEVYTLPLDQEHVAVERAERVNPDAFFAAASRPGSPSGILTEKAADAIAYDLGLGPDDSIWLYEGGVWRRRDNEVEKRLTRLLGNRYRASQLASVRAAVTLGRDLPMIEHEPNGRLINTRSGMVDWATGHLEPHDAAHLSTVQLTVDFDPLAECKNFDRWLKAVVPKENVKLAWEILGYMLMSGNPFHQAILLEGTGGNGKSTFLRVLLAILGKHNTSSITLRSISEGKFEVAGLFGKIANVAGDIDAKYLGDTSMFKAITGQDLIEAQHKYGHPFNFVPWAVPIFSANETWRSSDTTDGYFRRWTTLPFPNKVIGSDPSFDEAKLLAEAPGIFNKAIVHLRDLMARGEFELLGMAADLKREFEHESDVVQVWLKEDDHVTAHDAGNTDLRTERPMLYRTYAGWSRDNGHAILNSTNFYKRIERLGYGSIRTSTARYVTGIKLDIVSPYMALVNGKERSDVDD